jgi:uncharacterized protein
MNKAFKIILWVLFLTLILLGVPSLSGMIASFFDYQAIDPDGAYAWISVHHIVQALIFVIIIIILNKFKLLEYGFGWGNKEVGKKYVLFFTLIFGAGSLGTHLLMILTSSFQQFAYPLTATNNHGTIGFSAFFIGSIRRAYL